MIKEEAERIAKALKRSSKYNRRIRITGLRMSRGKAVIHAVHKVSGIPFTIAKNDKQYLEDKIERAKSPPAKLKLKTRHGKKLS